MFLLHRTLTLLFLIPFSLMAQQIRTKDGMLVGPRDRIIEGCAQKIRSDSADLGTATVDTKDYCSCMADSLIPSVTSQEIQRAQRSGDFKSLLFQEDQFSTLMNCLVESTEGEIGGAAGSFPSNLNDKAPALSDTTVPQEIRDSMTRTCKDSLLSTDHALWKEESADLFCNCATRKMLDSELSNSELMKIEDPRSKAFQKVIIPCMGKAMRASNEQREEKSSAKVIGKADSIVVPLEETVSGNYKLELSIGGQKELFLFDTGASELLIPEKLERKLLANGTIDPEDHQRKVLLTLADGSKTEVDMVKVDSIRIGDYLVKDATIGVIETGSYICGTGFLDQFSDWRFVKSKGELVIHK